MTTIAPLAMVLRYVRQGVAALKDGRPATAAVCLDNAGLWLEAGYSRLEAMFMHSRTDEQKAAFRHFGMRVTLVQRIFDWYATAANREFRSVELLARLPGMYAMSPAKENGI